MNPNKKICSTIGILFALILTGILINNIINDLLYEDFSSAPLLTVILFYGSFVLLISLSIVSVIIKPKVSALMQLSIIVMVGTITMMDADSSQEVMGEMILMASIFMAWRQGFLIKNAKLKMIVFFVYVIGIKVYISNGFNQPFTHYMSAIIGTSSLYLIIFWTNMADEKSIFEYSSDLCSKLSREEIFSKIGRRFYEEFLHDYNVDEGLMVSGLIKNHIIDGDTEQALDLIDTLIAMQKIDSQKAHGIKSHIKLNKEIEKAEIEVNDYINKTWHFLAGFVKVKVEEVKLKFDDHNFYTLISYSDFNIILRNIINNAVEATKDIPRELEITTEIKKDTGKIIIRDNGGGISFSERGNVPLSLFLPGKSTKMTGTGYGMVATIRKVQEVGWKMRVFNENIGCRVEISFPIYKITKRRGKNEKAECAVL